jgi:YD repeat-containing protein
MGNTINFSSQGIQHSAGRGVEFVRDWAGRITEIVLPDDTPDNAADNPRIRYTYDAVGDLREVRDRSDAVTKFFYDTPVLPLHILDRIEDPLGRTAASTEYENGRVKKVTERNKGDRSIFKTSLP